VQCALQFQSKRLASNGGVSAEEAAKEWAANIVPGGVPVIPVRNVGLESRPGSGLYILGGRLTPPLARGPGPFRASPDLPGVF